jgi:hypothetical protein
MKKVMLLVLTVMLVSAFLMASGPSIRMVRLTIINKSGNEVMIKLEGSDLGKQFYYLTIAAGTKSFPEVATFTVLEDIYSRTTWYGEGDNPQCVGTSSSGLLIMDKNVRLTFTPCYVEPKRTWYGYNSDYGDWGFWRAVNNGEPTQEKVVFYQTVRLFDGKTDGSPWDYAEGPWGYKDNVYFGRGCSNSAYYYYLSTRRVPVRGLCYWRYTY